VSLCARKLGVARAGRTLVHELDLCLAPGELLALLGPNGAGKSSLLRVLAGELAPSAGELVLQGRPLAEWKPAQLARRRALLEQQSALRFPLRALEVVTLGRIAHEEPERTALAYAARALEDAGAAEYAERVYTELSGGERQRVHLARALAQIAGAERAGALLFADEPCASQDPRHALAVLGALRAAAARGAAVVAALHDLNAAARFADRVLLLGPQGVLALGPPEAVLRPGLLQRAFGLDFDCTERASDGCLVVLPAVQTWRKPRQLA
jgi:iron complex transport system ATP-binding protein